jgi:hypothetical protein
MAKESTTFKGELAERDANYDIGTYEGYLMSKIQETEKEIRLNPQLKPLNPKNLSFDNWLLEERIKKVSFLTENGFDMPILAEILEVSVEDVDAVIQKLESSKSWWK